MSTVLDRGKTRGKQKTKAPAPARTVVPTMPQVNLLPPEVRAARSLAVVKRWLGISLLAVVVVVGLVYAFAQLVRTQADNELADADAQTMQLQAEERQYAEVPLVLGQIADIEEAQLVGTATEIAWKPYVDAITAVLPADVSIDSLSVQGPSPFAPPTDPVDPLQGASIGSISFEMRSKTVPNTSDMLDALAGVPGLADPWVSSVTASEEEGSTFYAVSATVQLTESTLSGRFEDVPDEAADEDAADEAATEGEG